MQIKHFEKVYFLGRVKALASLSPYTMDALAEESLPIKKQKGENIVIEGKPIEALYVTVFGTFDIIVSDSKVADCGEGELLGDHEILTDERNAKSTVKVASGYALLLRIPHHKILDLVDREPSLLMELTRSLARRWSEMEKRIKRWDQLFNRIKRDIGYLESSLHTIKQIASKWEEEKGESLELRYLVSVDNKILENANKIPIKQGYVALQKNSEIRIRYDGEKYTIAGKREYESRRIEIKLNIPSSLFEAFSRFVGKRLISKERYFLKHMENEWRIDIFDPETQCRGLAIAEVEIKEGEEVPKMPPGITVLSDITGDKRYRNQNLAEYGPPGDKSSE